MIFNSILIIYKTWLLSLAVSTVTIVDHFSSYMVFLEVIWFVLQMTARSRRLMTWCMSFGGKKQQLVIRKRKPRSLNQLTRFFFQINNEISASVTSYNRNILFPSNEESLLRWPVSSCISFLSFLEFFSVIFQIFHNDFNFNLKDNPLKKFFKIRLEDLLFSYCKIVLMAFIVFGLFDPKVYSLTHCVTPPPSYCSWTKNMTEQQGVISTLRYFTNNLCRLFIF